MAGRKRELNMVALFGARSIRADHEVQQELPADSAAHRKGPGDESRFAIDRRGWPVCINDQNLVVHAAKFTDGATSAAARRAPRATSQHSERTIPVVLVLDVVAPGWLPTRSNCQVTNYHPGYSLLLPGHSAGSRAARGRAVATRRAHP